MMIGSSHKASPDPGRGNHGHQHQLTRVRGARNGRASKKGGGEVNNDRTPGRRDAAQGIDSHDARGPIGRMYRSRHSAPVHGHYSGVLLLGHLDTQPPLVASQNACRGD